MLIGEMAVPGLGQETYKLNLNNLFILGIKEVIKDYSESIIDHLTVQLWNLEFCNDNNENIYLASCNDNDFFLKIGHL